MQSKTRSLSARRAWIEMMKHLRKHAKLTVALRKESVDRNNELVLPDGMDKQSLSARRAWIEI